ncbi:MAG: dioxygenase [Clostridiales bacterium]|nr:dioxygenase [Clostridiales bacterium]
MYGFPKELYEVKYAPAGSPELARKALELLGDAAREDHAWGIDHGIWSILSNMYPEADVPVVMISTNINASPKTLFEIGKRLQPLRREGAMILASGNVVHNLRLVDWSMSGGYEWADAFDRTIRDAVTDSRISVPLEYHPFTASVSPSRPRSTTIRCLWRSEPFPIPIRSPSGTNTGNWARCP